MGQGQGRHHQADMIDRARIFEERVNIKYEVPHDYYQNTYLNSSKLQGGYSSQ
jgi:hypothetical protein